LWFGGRNEDSRFIGQDHAGSDRLREIDFSRGSLPPNCASRRALSRSISARNPSRTSVAFLLTPVIRWASINNWSSIFSVVLMDGSYSYKARFMAYIDAIYLRRDILNVASATEQSTQRNRQENQYLFEKADKTLRELSAFSRSIFSF